MEPHIILKASKAMFDPFPFLTISLVVSHPSRVLRICAHRLKLPNSPIRLRRNGIAKNAIKGGERG
jgi:hypothetical protein